MTTPVPAATPLTGTIRNARWCNHDHRSPNICGDVYGNPRFGDGTFVWTSTVLEDLGGDLFRTRSGSIYRAEWADASQPGRPVALAAPAPAEPREGEAVCPECHGAGGHQIADDPRPVFAACSCQQDPSEAVAQSIASMVAEWYRGPARGDQDIPADLILRRLQRFAPRPARPDAGEAVAEPAAWRVDDLTSKGKTCGSFKIYDDRENVDSHVSKNGARYTKVTPLYAHPPAASAETARVAELADAWLAAWENSGLTVECRDVVSAEEWNAFARLMDAEAVKRRAALGAQEVQS